MSWWDKLTALPWWKEAVKLEYERLYLSHPKPTIFRTANGSAVYEHIASLGAERVTIHSKDNRYKLIKKEDFEAWLKHNQTDKGKYLVDFHDCENFAVEVFVDCQRWFPGVSVAEVELRLPEYIRARYHPA